MTTKPCARSIEHTVSLVFSLTCDPGTWYESQLKRKAGPLRPSAYIATLHQHWPYYCLMYIRVLLIIFPRYLLRGTFFIDLPLYYNDVIMGAMVFLMITWTRQSTGSFIKEKLWIQMTSHAINGLTTNVSLQNENYMVCLKNAWLKMTATHITN